MDVRIRTLRDLCQAKLVPMVLFIPFDLNLIFIFRNTWVNNIFLDIKGGNERKVEAK